MSEANETSPEILPHPHTEVAASDWTPRSCPGVELTAVLGSWFAPAMQRSPRHSEDGKDLDGEGKRRSAGSGTAKHAGSYSIRNPLPIDVGDGKTKAGAGGKIRGNDDRGDGSKALPKWAAGQAQRRSCFRGRVSRHPHHASMGAVSAAADGQAISVARPAQPLSPRATLSRKRTAIGMLQCAACCECTRRRRAAHPRCFAV